MTESLLNIILNNKIGNKPFALLYRPHETGTEIIEVMTGRISEFDTLGSIPLSENHGHSALVLIPYRQLSERGFTHIDDRAQLMALMIEQQETISIKEILKILPNFPIKLSEGYFDVDDSTYENIVKKVISDEIGYGEGSNFVIKRQFIAEISQYSIDTALTLYRHLLQNETNAYWTFLIHTGNRTFVGASPELHVNLKNSVVTMNPISGTYRYPITGPTLEGIKHFLSTTKEIDELYMVVEEELKMIAHFCPHGGTITGPHLKEMSRLAHTEYFIKGTTSYDPREILRETLFAPTVTGSPIENACRIIAKYEPKGRGYYSGIGALLGKDNQGNPSLDSAILIRTADINNYGRVSIGVGSTIVRHSDPKAEVDETWAKAKALLNAMEYRK